MYIICPPDLISDCENRIHVSLVNKINFNSFGTLHIHCERFEDLRQNLAGHHNIRKCSDIIIMSIVTDILYSIGQITCYSFIGNTSNIIKVQLIT